MKFLMAKATKQKPTCIDLFAGAGGLSVGLEKSGFKALVAVDFDGSACATYQRNFPDARTVNGDIREIRWDDLRGKVDLVAGGPPCQPFSVAGDQKASEDSRDMLPEFVRAVREIRPKAFLLENVAGLASNRHSLYFTSRLDDLRSLGYEVHYSILNSAEFGVPQERLRVIVLGHRKKLLPFPSPTHGDGRKFKYVSSRDAIANAPKDAPNKAIITYAKNPVLRPSPYAGMLVNGGGRPIDLSKPSQTIPASAGGNRTHIVDRSGVLLEYHKYLSAGGLPKSGKVEGARRLTLRESARLQSFPDTFEFIGEQSAKYRQVGNAVPPTLSYAIAEHILQHM